MRDTFLIKNNDPSFDQYFIAMKKRKNMIQMSGITNTLAESRSGVIKGKRPTARDGHSGAVDGDKMYIFGGDRHHMPFNDLYCLDLTNIK
jgi:hypothetical protein